MKAVVKGKLGTGDFIYFTGKAAEILGTDESDRLFASSKGSVLKGGFGDNELFGGAGADIFAAIATPYRSLSQSNTIFDFTAGVDRIDIATYGISSFNQLKRILESGTDGDTYFPLGGAGYASNSITIKGIAASKLSARDFIFYTGEKAQIVGTDRGERLFAAASGSTLKGGKGNDTLYGADGNDVLDGGEDDDIAYGGKGDDIYILRNPGDSAVEEKNEGIDLVKSYMSYTLSANIENLTLMGSGHAVGNELDNVIRTTSTGSDSTLEGLGGNDTLISGDGFDTLDGGAGADVMSGGDGDDVYIVDNVNDKIIEKSGNGYDEVLSSVSYTLAAHVEGLVLTGKAALSGTGNSLNNGILGNAGNDVLKGMAGNDRLVGYGGNDTLDGGSGLDEMDGGAGNDTYIVDDKGDLVVELKNQGTDLVKSSISYTLADNVENLTLAGGNINGTGNALANVITGGVGKNVLKGMAGDDILIGGLEADSLYGGKGKDTFVFASIKDSKTSVSGRDTIFDFSQKEGDRIDLSGIDAKVSTVKNDGFAFIEEAKFSKKAGELRFEKKSGDTIVYGDVDGDGNADFSIHIDLTMTLVKGDFIL